jgi:CRISPR-associated exonuclease Cas4
VSVLMLVLVLLLVLLVRALLARSMRRREVALGVETRTIVAADDSRIGAPTLRSARFRIVGRPDHLVRSGGVIIPIEQKPHARQLHDSHVLQVAAQCLLVQEVYGQRPPYGIVVLADGHKQVVPFTPALERRLLATMHEMRTIIASRREPGRRWVEHKCASCGFQRVCWR